MTMRRKDRQISKKEEIIEIIKNASTVTIGLNDNGLPYMVPVNHCYYSKNDKDFIAFHGAREGKKHDLINQTNKASFLIYHDDGVSEGLGFETTNYYRSIMGSGKIEVVEDFKIKQEVLSNLLKRFGVNEELKFTDRLLEMTAVMLVEIEELSAKANRR